MNLSYLIIILYLIILSIGISFSLNDYNPSWKIKFKERNFYKKYLKNKFKFINLYLVIFTIFTFLVLYKIPNVVETYSDSGKVEKISLYTEGKIGYITYNKNKIITASEITARMIEVNDDIKVTETKYFNIFGKEAKKSELKIENITKQM